VSDKAIATTRFVITGLGRCGSNLLKLALKQHPDIHMEGEYFNDRVFPDVFSMDGAVRAEDFFANAPGKCNGFKIFEHQARKEPATSAWDYLSSNTGIKVIYLKRKNCFDRVLSLKIAKISGQWIARPNIKDDITIKMSPSMWEELLRLDQIREQRLDDLFQHNDCYTFSYEDLVADWEGRRRDVQEFLGVEPLKLGKKLKKQETKHPSERCPNYRALKRHFKKTEFHWMFS